MASLIKKIKVMQQDGTYTDYIPIGVEAKNVDLSNGESLENTLNKKPYYYNTVADMQADRSLQIGDMAVTLGYYDTKDGGGATYIIQREIENSYFDRVLDNELYAIFLNKKKFNILQVGAKRNDDTYNNRSILNPIFNEAYFNDTTIYIPNGTYYTTSLGLPYGSRQNTTRNLTLIGLGKPMIKLLKPGSTKTVIGTYQGNYSVSRGIAEIDFGNSCTIGVIKLVDNKEFYYFKISDKTLIPEGLSVGHILEGMSSYTKAVIAGIDKDDPDGEGTARIYLYETYNDYTRFLNYSASSSILNEKLLVKRDLREDTLYIHFNDNIIPDYITVGNQFEQVETGKRGRIDNISITFGDKKFVAINCLAYDRNIFITPITYLDSNVPFNINQWTVPSYTMFSINKFINFTMKNIVWDGDNLKESYYNAIYNNYNICITGGCKNVLIEDCTFQNAVMAGFQIGGTGGSMYKIAAHDFPEDVTVRNCQFYNNGRNDLEVIYGYNINIEDCHFDRRVDFESNGTEPFCQINVNNCYFNNLVIYNPGTQTAAHHVNVNNSRIFSLAHSDASVLNLTNCKIHTFSPQISTTKAVNCYFNMLSGLVGNEFLSFVNTSLYSFYKGTPGGQAGNAKLYFDNCVIDLSLTTSKQYIQSIREFKIDNSIIVSNTTRKTINDYRTVYKCHNSTFKNIKFVGGAGQLGSITTGTEFIGCNFLAKDNTMVTSNVCASDAIVGGIFKDCYFEESVQCYLAYHSFINCILNSTTKPSLTSREGIYCSGIKTDNGSGINWRWVGTPAPGWKVKFNNIEFAPDITNTLGIKWGYSDINTNSVDDSCRGYYVGNTDLAFCKIYYNNNTLAVKQISFE